MQAGPLLLSLLRNDENVLFMSSFCVFTGGNNFFSSYDSVYRVRRVSRKKLGCTQKFNLLSMGSKSVWLQFGIQRFWSPRHANFTVYDFTKHVWPKSNVSDSAFASMCAFTFPE